MATEQQDKEPLPQTKDPKAEVKKEQGPKDKIVTKGQENSVGKDENEADGKQEAELGDENGAEGEEDKEDAAQRAKRELSLLEMIKARQE